MDDPVNETAQALDDLDADDAADQVAGGKARRTGDDDDADSLEVERARRR